MNVDTLVLLTFPPEHALLVLANETLGINANPDNMAIIDINSVLGPVTEATIEARYSGAKPINEPSIANLYEGQTTFLFTRLNLTTVFGDSFAVNITVPTTVKDVLSQIYSKTGIVFDDNDFAQEKIDSTTFTLQALPKSRRWTGELNLVLGET